MSVEDVELAAPGPGEVEVKLAASGVCHSDWNVVTGATANPLPAVLGHEGAGVVESLGDGVDSVAEGDHVILSWLPACGRCYYCSRGRQVLCDVAMEDMFRGTLPGGALRLSQNGDPLYHYSPHSRSAASSRRDAVSGSVTTRRSRSPPSSAAP
jgi:S-(hydroxymethyl)glutathione dehydrogenase/alcohol dehydrogenase